MGRRDSRADRICTTGAERAPTEDYMTTTPGAAPAAPPAPPAAPAAPATPPAAPAAPAVDSLLPESPPAAPAATATPQTEAEKIEAARKLVKEADAAADPNSG